MSTHVGRGGGGPAPLLDEARVGHFMHGPVVDCPASATLAEVAERMATQRIHCVVVPPGARRHERAGGGLGRRLRHRPRGRRGRSPDRPDGRRDRGDPSRDGRSRRAPLPRGAAHVRERRGPSAGGGRRARPARGRHLHARHRRLHQPGRRRALTAGVETAPGMAHPETSVIAPEALDGLVAALRGRGFRVLGPTVRDGAVVYDDLASAAELPAGWTDVQAPGVYRLERRDDEARFGYAVGPHSWKRFLFPARVRLWRALRGDGGELEVQAEPPDETPLALLGVRACELHAIGIQDRVLLEGGHVDGDYAARRTGAFVVAVNCFEPAATCFCASMGTGPGVGAGHDLVLTEILAGGHRLLAEPGTERGAEVLRELERRPATAADLRAAEAVGGRRRGADGPGGRHRPGSASCSPAASSTSAGTTVADRCLSCANCTMVCPTCFCTAVEDTTDLSGREAERARAWDSCFSVEHSHVHGGSIRPVDPVPVPPVAHPQVRNVDRPVRHVGLRGVRPLHRLVPRRDRRDRGAARRSGASGGGRCGRLTSCCATCRCSRACRRTPCGSCRAAPATCGSGPARSSSGRGRAPIRSSSSGTERSPWRCSSHARAGHHRDARRRRGPRMVLAVPALPVALRRPGADAGAGHRVRRRLPPPALRAGSRARLRPHVPPRAGGIERLQWTRLRLLDVYGHDLPA